VFARVAAGICVWVLHLALFEAVITVQASLRLRAAS
jgi:hypothetical protein